MQQNIRKDVAYYVMHNDILWMRSLKIEQVQTFMAVLDSGTFSAAADRLRISQPAVSVQVRQLEHRLGVRLFERVGKRATPTRAGTEFASHARRIAEAVSDALSSMDAHTDGASGRVRIGTGATACIYLLPPVLRELRRRHPSLDITVRTGNTQDILRSLEANETDVGFVTLPAPGRMFDVTPTMQDGFVAIAGREDDPLPAIVTPQALEQRPMVAYESGGTTRRILDDWFARAGVRPNPVMDLGNVEAIKELVGAGFGCAVLPGTAIRRNGEPAPLTVRPLDPPLWRELGIVVRRDKPLTRGLRETMAALRQIA